MNNSKSLLKIIVKFSQKFLWANLFRKFCSGRADSASTISWAGPSSVENPPADIPVVYNEFLWTKK